MKLYAACEKCKSDISFWTWKETRMDFKKSKKENILLSCKKCNHSYKYSIDFIYAKESKIAMAVGLIILVAGSSFSMIFLWDYLFQTNNIYTIFGLTGILLIPSIVYRILSKNDVQRVRDFNRS